MSKNIQQFSIYTAKIFEILYDSFPIPICIDRNEIITEYLFFDKNDELKILKNKQGIAEIFEMIDEPEMKELAKKKLPQINRELNDLEAEKHSEKAQQIAILNGTLEFLVTESLIRESENGGYQLTSKSFSHLNKNFKNSSINEVESSYITILKSVFKKSPDMTLDIASGIAINVISKLLDIS